MKVRPLAFSCSFVPLEGTLEQFLVSLPVSQSPPGPFATSFVTLAHFYALLARPKKSQKTATNPVHLAQHSGMQSKPKRAQIGPTNNKSYGGKKYTNQDQRAAHALTKWILSMNGDTKTRWRCQSMSRRVLWMERSGPIYGDFGPFSARFGPKLIRAEIFPLGPGEAQCGRKPRFLGRKRTPKMNF